MGVKTENLFRSVEFEPQTIHPVVVLYASPSQLQLYSFSPCLQILEGVPLDRPLQIIFPSSALSRRDNLM
jgi:hypothetical protein